MYTCLAFHDTSSIQPVNNTAFKKPPPCPFFLQLHFLTYATSLASSFFCCVSIFNSKMSQKAPVHYRVCSNFSNSCFQKYVTNNYLAILTSLLPYGTGSPRSPLSVFHLWRHCNLCNTNTLQTNIRTIGCHNVMPVSSTDCFQ